MACSGYVLDPSKVPIAAMYDQSIKSLMGISDMYKIGIMASLPYADGNRYTNRAVLVDAVSGLMQTYDKIHLYTPAGESREYTSGNEIKNFTFRNWTIRPCICYDLRFPSIAYEGDYDLLVYMANWPVTRISHWTQLIKARAIENQVFAVGVNRVGADNNNLLYNGNSIAVSYDGTTILDLGGEEAMSCVNLDLELQKSYRKSLPFRLDRRDKNL
jgi:predicted amidohydrolase